MAEKEVLNHLRAALLQEAQTLQPAPNRGFYVCPLCGSGSHRASGSTGAFKIDGATLRWHCFSCGEGGDIFDLYEKRDHLSKSDAAKEVLRRYGPRSSSPASPVQRTMLPAAPQPREEKGKSYKDFRPYLEQCAKALPGSAGERYLMGRGLTQETLRRFGVGYDAQAAAVVIPYPEAEHGYHSKRLVTPQPGESPHRKPRADEAGPEPLFNVPALYKGAEVVFVVEAQLCALSIEQEGCAAVAIGGTTGERKLLSQLEKQPTSAALVVCLDNDKPSENDPEKDKKTAKRAQELAEKLRERGFTALQDNTICGNAKDPNDALQADRAAFRAALASVQEKARAALRGETEEAADAREEYQGENMAGYLATFMQEVIASGGSPAIPTGFAPLDNQLDGGLFPGLYIIGAISSLGKTTFALQMLDQIAAAGNDCIIFSLEMARSELVAKSISRLTFQAVMRNGSSPANAKTTRGILNGSKYSAYSQTERHLIAEALKEYEKGSGARLWIHEGMGNIGAAEVRAAVAKHITITGRSPVVLIDYLQILAPANERATDKQNTDKAVLELKRMSRDFKIPVIAISSLNRDNYTAPINTAAFKESGAIEYSADVLMGMQLAGMEYKEGEGEKDREKRMRELARKADAAGNDQTRGKEVEIVVLKNRNGRRGIVEPFTFYPMFNCFIAKENGFTPIAADTQSIFGDNKKPLRRY